MAGQEPAPPEEPLGFQACWTACCRLCGVTPLAALSLMLVLSASTVYNGWVHPAGLRPHPYAELVLFLLFFTLMVSSYLSAVLRGPGYVPRGWKPSADAIKARLGPPEELPLDTHPPLADCLQYCKECEGWKPPRAHHCSMCNRCVLWMDHHCPWTGTCVGHQNLQSFVLFVHYVPLTCFHSLIVHGELPLKLCQYWFRGQKTLFWSTLPQLHALAEIVCFIAVIVVLGLVGGLAWDMHWTLNNNQTMVEELVVEKAEARKTDRKDQKFIFPYDLGPRRNKAQVLGRTWRECLLPRGPLGDGYWPEIKDGSHHLDLGTEQIAQKAEKLARSVVVRVAEDFDGEALCFCTYWCHIGYKYGCSTAFCCPVSCGETKLTVVEGEDVLVSRQEGKWLFARATADGLDGAGGWLPRGCFAADKGSTYQVPFQKELQGFWEGCSNSSSVAAANGDDGDHGERRRIRVSGCLARVMHSRSLYALRNEDDSTTLLGCKLLECDGETARWSNGDVWERPDMEDSDGGAMGKKGPSSWLKPVPKNVVTVGDLEFELPEDTKKDR